MLLEREVNLDKRTPRRAFGLPHQVHARLRRGTVAFMRVALDTGADNILPRGRPTPVAWNDMVEV